MPVRAESKFGETPENPFDGARVPQGRVRSASVDDFKSATASFNQCILSGRKILKSRQAGTEIPLDALLKAGNQLAHHVRALTDIANALPAPADLRDPNVGKAFLPLAMYSWTKAEPEGTAALLSDIYKKSHLDTSGKYSIKAPDWLRGMMPYFSFHQYGEGFPSHESYLKKSQFLAAEYNRLQEELATAKEKLGNIQEKNEKAVARSGNSPFKDVLPGLEQNVAEIKARIPVLFDQLTDVTPEMVPEALNRLGIRVLPNTSLFKSVQKLEVAVERIVAGAALATSGAKLSDTTVEFPVLRGKGRIEGVVVKITPEELKKLGQDPVKLSRIVTVLDKIRCNLQAFFPHFEDFPGADSNEAGLHDVLREPLSRFEGVGKSAVLSLLSSDSLELKASLAGLFQRPVSEGTESSEWYYALERLENAEILRWTLSNFLIAESKDEAEVFAAVLDSSPTVSESVAGLAREVRQYYRDDDFEALALLLNNQIAEQAGSVERNMQRSLALIFLAREFARDDEVITRLRHQIPELEKLKDLSGYLLREDKSLRTLLNESVHETVRRLSSSLADFYKGEGAEELWEFIEIFSYYMQHPEILEGVGGNEGMRSGILLIGEPGVGKTYLTDCLRNELNIKMFSISPESKTTGQESMIDVARRTINEAKKYSQDTGPCIVFIDEAEAIMAERDDFRTTREQAELTDYLLQEINDIRMNYPKILIIAASNFEDRIDEAMMRDGRLDYVIYMGPPEDDTRKAIMLDTIAAQKIPLDLTDQELGELVEISKGFMPLQIKRTVIETHRVYGPMKTVKNSDYQLTFEVLKERFLGEQKRLKNRIKRRERKGSIYLKKMEQSQELMRRPE